MFRARGSTRPGNRARPAPQIRVGNRCSTSHAELLILETILRNDIVNLPPPERPHHWSKKMTRRRRKAENIVSEALIATHFSSLRDMPELRRIFCLPNRGSGRVAECAAC